MSHGDAPRIRTFTVRTPIYEGLSTHLSYISVSGMTRDLIAHGRLNDGDVLEVYIGKGEEDGSFLLAARYAAGGHTRLLLHRRARNGG